MADAKATSLNYRDRDTARKFLNEQVGAKMKPDQKTQFDALVSDDAFLDAAISQDKIVVVSKPGEEKSGFFNLKLFLSTDAKDAKPETLSARDQLRTLMGEANLEQKPFVPVEKTAAPEETQGKEGWLGGILGLVGAGIALLSGGIEVAIGIALLMLFALATPMGRQALGWIGEKVGMGPNVKKGESDTVVDERNQVRATGVSGTLGTSTPGIPTPTPTPTAVLTPQQKLTADLRKEENILHDETAMRTKLNAIYQGNAALANQVMNQMAGLNPNNSAPPHKTDYMLRQIDNDFYLIKGHSYEGRVAGTTEVPHPGDLMHTVAAIRLTDANGLITQPTRLAFLAPPVRSNNLMLVGTAPLGKGQISHDIGSATRRVHHTGSREIETAIRAAQMNDTYRFALKPTPPVPPVPTPGTGTTTTELRSGPITPPPTPVPSTVSTFANIKNDRLSLTQEGLLLDTQDAAKWLRDIYSSNSTNSQMAATVLSKTPKQGIMSGQPLHYTFVKDSVNNQISLVAGVRRIDGANATFDVLATFPIGGTEWSYDGDGKKPFMQGIKLREIHPSTPQPERIFRVEDSESQPLRDATLKTTKDGKKTPVASLSAAEPDLAARDDKADDKFERAKLQAKGELPLKDDKPYEGPPMTPFVKAVVEVIGRGPVA